MYPPQSEITFFVILQVLAGRDGEMLLKNMGVWNFLLISLETKIRWILKIALTKKNQRESPFQDINFVNDFYKSKYVHWRRLDNIVILIKKSFCSTIFVLFGKSSYALMDLNVFFHF